MKVFHLDKKVAKEVTFYVQGTLLKNKGGMYIDGIMLRGEDSITTVMADLILQEVGVPKGSLSCTASNILYFTDFDILDFNWILKQLNVNYVEVTAQWEEKTYTVSEKDDKWIEIQKKFISSKINLEKK